MVEVVASHFMASFDYFPREGGVFPHGTGDTEKCGGKIELFQEIEYRRGEPGVRTVIEGENTPVLFCGTTAVNGAEKACFKIGYTDDQCPEMQHQEQGQCRTKLRQESPQNKGSTARGRPDKVRAKARVQQVPPLPRSVNKIR